MSYLTIYFTHNIYKRGVHWGTDVSWHFAGNKYKGGQLQGETLLGGPVRGQSPVEYLGGHLIKDTNMGDSVGMKPGRGHSAGGQM